MRVAVAAVQTPFIRGGAQLHVENLNRAIREAGHESEIITLPFKFSPASHVRGLMAYCEGLDFSDFSGYRIDRLIALQFPLYGVSHPDKRIWVMHQHRAVYDLYDPAAADAETAALKEAVTRYDSAALSDVSRLYANSKNVADRLMRYNGVKATPLYHPPADAERFYCAEPMEYLFYPSRLERLKRQDLLIEAMRRVRSPVKLVLAGSGGQESYYRDLIARYGLQERVALLGEISDTEKLAWYAHALGVCFPAYDEDYGYVPLEAMLSAKPVITCRDSGGPLEFVEDRVNGMVAEPTPEALADAIDTLCGDRSMARTMGRAGRERYDASGIGWNHVLEQLLA